MKKNTTIILVIIILSMLFLIKYISNTLKEWEIEDNLRTYSVYYAKNMPHAKDKSPVLIMLIDNLEFINKPKIEGIKYDIDGLNYIISYKDELTEIKSFGNIFSDDTNYIYSNENNISYRFNKNFKLSSILNINYEYIDTSTVNEQKIIAEIYELVQPIIDAQPEPEINLQEEFNKRYQEQFN